MTDGAPSLTGHCLCGAVRFEVAEPLISAQFCHCTRCQRRTGTAFAVSGAVVPGSFRIIEGEQLVHAFRPPDGWAKFFCTQCGGHLYSQSQDEPERIGVRMGAIDGEPGVRPSRHQFGAYAAPWFDIPDDGLPRFDERAPAA